MNAIETNALTKRYGDVTAIDGLDLVVEEGDSFGFLGPNGAGKSTTIDVLLGFVVPSSGSATVLGHDVRSESKALRRRVGVLPEGMSVYDRLTGREHVRSATRMKNADDDPERLLDYVGLDSADWDRPAGDYSKGMQQRLGLAMALVGDPDLLILDEPSSGLDPTGMQDVREIVREQSDLGRTVFFSSHILPEVEAVCDRVGILNDGYLVATDTVDTLRETAGLNSEVELRVNEIPGGLDLTSLDGVTNVEFGDGTIRAICVDPEVKIEVIKLVDEETQIFDVVAEDAALEAVFNTYTMEKQPENPSEKVMP